MPRNKVKEAALARERYAKNPKPSIAKAKRWHQENLDKRRAMQREEYYRHPNKTKASVAVNRAIKKGLLVKLPCAICGALNTEGHHFSYEKENWLDVLWLCRTHHREAHRGLHPQIKLPS